MFRPFAYFVALLAFFGLSSLHAETPSSNATSRSTGSSYKAFTGKVVGNHVRMRTSPDLDSHIVLELPKDEYIVVSGEKGEFYAVEPPADLKAYIFRGFVIDDVVEGDRVNIRLSPDREAPIIGHYSTGTNIDGKFVTETPNGLKSMHQQTLNSSLLKNTWNMLENQR